MLISGLDGWDVGLVDSQRVSGWLSGHLCERDVFLRLIVCLYGLVVESQMVLGLLSRHLHGLDVLQVGTQRVSGWLIECLDGLDVLLVGSQMVFGLLIGSEYGLDILLVDLEWGLGWRQLVFHCEKLEVEERMIC